MGDPEPNAAPTGRIDRRAFVRGLMLGAGAVLAACSKDAPPPARTGATQPGNGFGPTFIGGMPVERGATLRVYEWKDYLAKDVIESFERRFKGDGVRVKVESFVHMEEAVERLQHADADYDVFFPTPEVVDQLAAMRLIQPLQHSLLPNERNLWPWFREDQGPEYDPGQRYTVPYTVFTTGIGWRSDLVASPEAPDRAADPYGIFWDARYRGRLGMYDDHVEALALALARAGVADLWNATDDELAAAADDLIDAVTTVDLAFTAYGAWDGLPEGEFAAHQAWSGDILTARRYALEEGEPEVISELRYWFPPGEGRVVGCDLMAVCERGMQPELAHAFIDHLLDEEIALANFRWNGYQPPLTAITPDAVVSSSVEEGVPPDLIGAVLTEEDFAGGQLTTGLSAEAQVRWLDQWNRVVDAT